MPLYKDYECNDCEGEVFEIFKEQGKEIPFPESPTCPKCGGTNTKSSFKKIGESNIGIAIPVYMRAPNL